MLNLITNNIPNMLKNKAQWVGFIVTDEGQKLPVDPKPLSFCSPASIADSTTWGTFEQAVNLVQHNLAIAVGYAVAALAYLFSNLRTQIALAIVLLLAYWASMEFISIDGFGGGDYTPQHNLAEWIDRSVLGRFRDHATVENGVVVWSEHYHYTWILSSLTFGFTGLAGMFAGSIAKSAMEERKKLWWMFGTGIAMIAVAMIWSIWMPIIKIIWTSSMALYAAGLSFILLGVFYYFIDYKGYRRGITWLKVYGMNAIAAYMLTQIVNFRGVANSLFYGLEQYLGDYYNVLITLSQVGIIYLILLVMYRKKIFLKA